MQWGGKRRPEPAQGIKFLVGQFTAFGVDRDGGVCHIDLSERKNFERSKYIPGNGPEHRLGKPKQS